MTPDPHPYLTLFLSIWGAVGPLFGVFVGGYLSTRQQRKQWRRNNVKQECREIVEAITNFRFALYEAWGPSEERKVEDLTQQTVRGDFKEKGLELQRILASRVLIDEDIRRSNLGNRLSNAIDEFKADYFNDQESSHNKLRDVLFTLLNEVILIAK